jgi:DNA-binding beta-propeller fold protein YncE
MTSQMWRPAKRTQPQWTASSVWRTGKPLALGLLTAAVLIAAMGLLIAGDGTPGAGDTRADRVLGQPDFLHNAENSAKANSLYFPSGAAIDSRGSLYIADSRNSRVLAWHSVNSLTTGAPADLIIGQPDFVSGGCNHGVAKGDRLGVGPDSLCLLPANGDSDEFGGLAVDAAGNLFVADPGNSRVLEYDSPFDKCTSLPCIGIAADRIIGQPDFTSNTCNLGLSHASSKTLCGPNSAALDGSGNLYVADTGNDRILEYNTPLDAHSGEISAGDATADMVFGPSNFYDGGSQCFISPLCTPLGVAVDAKGNLWVADSGNNEVLEFNTPLDPNSGAPGAGDAFPDAILGGSDCPFSGQVPRATGTCEPSAVALDKAGNLFVADWGDSRVLEFNTPLNAASGEPGAGDATADRVFGQPTFTEGFCNRDSSPFYAATPSASMLCRPYGLALDSSGNLYVADQSNNRVMIYRSPLNAHSGEPGAGDAAADVVLGQKDFFLDGANLPDAGSLAGPQGTALDSAGRLWVADPGNGRVLGWRNASSFADGAPADLVIGKPDFEAVGCQRSGYLCDPSGVAADSGGNLYVTDSLNSRVLEYNSPFATCSKFPCVGSSPNLVFGQATLDSQGCNQGNTNHPNAQTLCAPQGVAVDALGNLYIVDSNNHRVLEYNTPLNPRSGEPGAGDTVADIVFGQTAITSQLCWGGTVKPSAANLCYPAAVAVDSFGNLYVVDDTRVLE